MLLSHCCCCCIECMCCGVAGLCSVWSSGPTRHSWSRGSRRSWTAPASGSVRFKSQVYHTVRWIFQLFHLDGKNLRSYADKKEKSNFLHIKKDIQNGAVTKFLYMTNVLFIYCMVKYCNCAFPHILGSHSSYITLQLRHSEFPYI